MEEQELKEKLIGVLEQHVWSAQNLNQSQINSMKIKMENFSLEQLEKTVKSQTKHIEGVVLENLLNKKLNSESTGKIIDKNEIKDLIKSLVEKETTGSFDKLQKSVFKMIANDLPVFKIQIGSQEAKNIGLSHRLFPKLLAISATRTGAGDPLNIWLTGPAGSGKTKAAETVAKVLERNFYFNGAIDTEYKLSGFVDAQGRVVSTAFKEAYKNGGVYLFDEVDASLPGALLAFNAALANGYADFPEGKITRHPDCIIIAAANTWGTGPNSDYVGRNKLDAAFIDRFVQLAWDYDPLLEKAISNCDEWVDYVQALRKNAMKHEIKVVISPRASISGAALLKSGNFTIDEVIAFSIKKGMPQSSWDTLSLGVSKTSLENWHSKYLNNLKEEVNKETPTTKRKVK